MISAVLSVTNIYIKLYVISQPPHSVAPIRAQCPHSDVIKDCLWSSAFQLSGVFYHFEQIISIHMDSRTLFVIYYTLTQESSCKSCSWDGKLGSHRNVYILFSILEKVGSLRQAIST